MFVARPVVEAFTSDEMEVSLAHEVAHHDTHDNLKRLLVACSPDLLGIWPSGRALERRWRAAVEFAADDRAVDGEESRAVALASALIKVARLSPAAAATGSASAFYDGTLLAARIDRLLASAGDACGRRRPAHAVAGVPGRRDPGRRAAGRRSRVVRRPPGDRGPRSLPALKRHRPMKHATAAVIYGALAVGVGFGLVLAAQARPPASTGAIRFDVSVPAKAAQGPIDGRLLVMVSNDDRDEPRFQISDGPSTQVIAGVDVNGMQAGQPVVVDATAVAYPIDSLAALPPGTYNVQALLQRYETFHRADGKIVKLPMDQGEGRQWNRAPGNLYSTPRKVVIHPGHGGAIEISLDKVIPPIPPPPETKVHQARPDPEREAHEVLGAPDVPGRARPAAAGVRRASRTRATRWSSTTGTSRTPSRASGRSRPTRR